MSFLIRVAVCVLAVVSLSVLAAWAWDGSDEAAGVPGAVHSKNP